MIERRAVWQRLYVPTYLTAGAVVCGWLGVYFAFQQHLLGIALPLVTTALPFVPLRRGGRLARSRRPPFGRAGAHPHRRERTAPLGERDERHLGRGRPAGWPPLEESPSQGAASPGGSGRDGARPGAALRGDPAQRARPDRQ